MVVEACKTRTIETSAERIAEIATAVAHRLGWNVKFVGDNELSALEKITDYVHNVRWEFEYGLSVAWEEYFPGVKVTAKVTEKKMQWTEEKCRQRCEDILEKIEQDVVRAQTQNRNVSEMYGSARWATDDELLKEGYIAKSGEARRFVLGPALNGEVVSVPVDETVMHTIVCGPTGCGKSSTIFIPNLIERTGLSAIVTEATAGDEPPDLFQKTSGFRKMSGHKIYKFNPNDLTSHRINPLEYVKSYDQASQIASLLIENTSSRVAFGDKIWENSERQLLTTLIVHATSEGGNLGAIRRWLRQGPEGLGMILMNSPMEEAREEFRGFYKNSSEGFRNGVVSGLMQRLNLWVNPRIVALTEKTDIDIKALPEELFTLYLAVPAQKTHLKPLAALIFNFVLNLALEVKFKHPFGLFLDEFTNYGYIPGIAEKLTIIRHRKIPATLGFQDFVQLRKVYGDEDASLLFSQPGTKIFFRPRDIGTAKKISESLGIKTVHERKVTSTGQIQEREFGRPLLNASEVMAVKRGYAIAFTPSTAPIMLKTFTWQRYDAAMKYEPPEFRTLKVDEELVRLCNEAKAKADWQDGDGREQFRGEKYNKSKPRGEPKMERNRTHERNYDERAHQDRLLKEKLPKRVDHEQEPEHDRDKLPDV